MEKEMKKVKVEYFQETEFFGVKDDGEAIYRTYTYGVAICPFCGYECDAILRDNSEFPSLLDDVCLHLRRVKDGIAYFSKEERPEINPFKRY